MRIAAGGTRAKTTSGGGAARKPRKAEVLGPTLEILLFEAAGHTFAAPVSDVERVIKREEREDEISAENVVDLAQALTGGLLQAGTDARLIMCRSRGTETAVLVSSIKDIVRVPLADIHPLPPFVRQALAFPFVRRIARLADDHLIVLLELREIGVSQPS